MSSSFSIIKAWMITKCHCHLTNIFMNVRNCVLPYFSSSTILEAKNIGRFRAQIKLNVLQNDCCLEAPLELISSVALQCHHTSHIRHHTYVVGVVGFDVLPFDVRTSVSDELWIFCPCRILFNMQLECNECVYRLDTVY